MARHEGAYISKWVTFAASTLIQASAGLTYSFSLYAPTVKDSLDLTQTQIATVGSAINIGGYFAIISGTVYDNIQEYHKLGPRLVVWMGCICGFCGYLGMYLMVSGQAPRSFLQLLIFATAAGNMGTWFDTSALVTNLRNFKNSRGFVVGVLKSFLGLSSSIYTTVYITLLEPDTVQFLLVLALAPSILSILLSFGLNYVPFVEASEGLHNTSWFSTEGRFLMSFLLVAALALYQMASAVLIGQQHLSPSSLYVILGGMAMLLMLAAGLPLHCGGWRAQYAHDYITTRESLADDEESPTDHRPGSTAARQSWQGGARGSDARVASQPTAHHRAAAGSAGTSRHGSSHRQKPLGHPQSKTGSRPASPVGKGANGNRVSTSSSGRSPLSASQQFSEDESEAPLLVVSGYGNREDGKGATFVPEAAGAAGNSNSTAAPGVEPSSRPGTQQHQQAALQLSSLTTQQMLQQLDFWLLFLQFTVAAGVCLSFVNNLGQLVVALEGGHDGHVVFVSLFSVANAGGRLLMGYIPEQHLHAKGTPRTLFLTITAAATSAASLAVAYANLSHLYIISILLGLAFGAHWSLLPAILSDLFGLKHFAANYTTLQFAPAAGSFLLATRLTGWLYDQAAAKHGDPHECIGPDCFRKAFLLLSGLSAISSVACSIATSRSKLAYQAISAHLRQVDMAEGHPHGGDS